MPARLQFVTRQAFIFILQDVFKSIFLSFLQFSDSVFCRRRFQGNQEGGYLSVLIYHLSLNST